MSIRLLLPLLLLTATATAQQYDLRRYSLAEGLPQSQVFAAIQDSRGYMWFGTQGGGVCRFDGLDFQTFTTDDGIPSNFVSAIFEDSEGRIWVADDRRYGYFDGKKWNTQRVKFGEYVNAFGQTPKGQLLIGFGNGGGLASHDSAGLRSIAHGFPKVPSIYAFFPSKSGLWLGTNQGAMPFGKPAQRLTTKEGLPSNTVRAFALDAQGNLWLATPSGIAVVDESSLKILTVHKKPLLENALCLQADGEGNIWVGTAGNGISIWSPKDSVWTQITEKQGLPHNHVRALVCDNTGQMWAATSGGGVVRFVAQDFTHYDRSDGLAGDRVYAVMEDRRGRIWFSVSQNGLQWLDSAGIHRFERDSGYLNVKCRTLAEDKFSRLWVGTEGKGVAIFDSSGMRILGKTNGLPSDWIQKIVADPSGDMWVATASDGIARVSFPDSNSFAIKIFDEKNGISNKRISAMCGTTYKNSVYLGTQSGEYGLIDDNRAVIYNEYYPPTVPIRCITYDSVRFGRFVLKTIWVGTKGEGVHYFGWNAHAFLELQTPRPLSSKNIYLLQFDRVGNLWVGSENGVDKITFEKHDFAVESVEHFGKNEGFLGIETCQDAAICDRAGNLWFGTMNGLTKYTPSNRKFVGSVPILHFENTTLFYKPLSETSYSKWADASGGIREGLELPWNQNHLSFEFRAIDLNRPDAVQYRWKLDGLAIADWSPLSPQRSVNFAGLPPGQYTFQVQATSDGETFTEPLKASFSIKIPFWQNGWFQFAAGFALLGAIFLFAKNRIRQVRKTEQAKREKLEMQNHLLQLEQKALQLQMNPHFIFNALNSIQSLVSTGDAASARQELNAFAKLMRSILNNSRRQTISLQEEADTLEQYLRIEQFCQQNKFDFSIQLPENVDAAELELPPMLLQPFVENAVVHGVSHLKYKGKIEVEFRFNPTPDPSPEGRGVVAYRDGTSRTPLPSGEGSGVGLLECFIRDNGVGREKAALLRQERTPGHASVAVEVTRERLEALKNGQNYEVLEYEDLTDSEGKIVGTQVIVRFPANMNF
jgi:ligand-binding sensor domain-containing protein